MTQQPTLTTPAGLILTKSANGWTIRHDGGSRRLPLHQGDFGRESDAMTALAKIAALDIDWTQPASEVRAAVERTCGEHEVRRIATPPEEIERRRRVTANSVRYLRALEADGARVVGTASYGAASVYRMSCGCQRSYSAVVGSILTMEGPTEDLPLRCDRHRDLHVEGAATDVATIRRELRAVAR